MSGGETNPQNTIAYIVAQAVTTGGLIVTRGATAGYMELAQDASSDVPEGYTYSAPLKATGVSPAAGDTVGIHALINGQKAEFVLPATHAAIAYGDKVTMTTAGKVVKTTAGPCWVLGTSEDAVDQNTGGYVEIRVNVYYLAA